MPAAVSVVLNVYNAEDIIEEFMESLAAQSYTGFRLLVVDDGSTDRTIQKIEGYRDQIDMDIHRRPHQGLRPARKYGVEKAEGDIVAVCDADLILDSHALEELVRPLQRKNIGGVGGVLKGRGDGVVAEAYGALREMFYRFREKKGEADWLAGGFCAFKKDILRETGGLSLDTLSADLDISWKIKDAGYTLLLNDGAVAYHRDPDSLNGIWTREKNIGRREYRLGQKHPRETFKIKRVLRFYPLLLPVVVPLLAFLCWPALAVLFLASYVAMVAVVEGDLKRKSMAWLVFNVMNAGYCAGFLSALAGRDTTG